MENVLNPPASLLVKIGSIIVHAEELMSPNGHEYDRIALQQLMRDVEVKTWLEAMDAGGFLPKKR